AGGGAAAGAPPRPGGGPRPRGPPTTAPPALDILVTNDDGIIAPGIDAVVRGLRALPGVTVTIVAPASQQSGTGGKTSPTTPAHHDAVTASGIKGTAVEGFPADSVNVAFDVLGLKPDVVVSGINQGQNLGPVVDLSGTVGAARAAAAHGVPAIASSLGLGPSYDYSQAADLVVDWVTEHRDEFTGGSGAPLDTVANLNIPNCGTAKIRGEEELAHEAAVPDMSTALTNGQDCASAAAPSTEVATFNAGYATLTAIPAKPAQ
ncbi:5'/3'-nucleotidase SurE, partial [Frankia sp. CNm7]|uniref:5'/3'-nucleotidase SurE n=1 Tax=Frankia nepalensis TaxID=1836974 RepID=UPI00193233F1